MNGFENIGKITSVNNSKKTRKKGPRKSGFGYIEKMRQKSIRLRP